ncbi:MAG: hypothetical protein PQJ58_03140 [Spirochaetales bacterium]|nr:hypothetical protein [Spirochaetales bacterium]
MKSIAYALFHAAPKTYDDCLHYQKRPDAGLTLTRVDLVEEERVTPDFFLTVLKGCYHCVMNNGEELSVEKIYGALFSSDSPERKARKRQLALSRARKDAGLLKPEILEDNEFLQRANNL